MGTSRRKFMLNNNRSAADYYRYDKFFKFVGTGTGDDLVKDITVGNFNIYLTHIITSPSDKSISGLSCLKNVQFYFRPSPDNNAILGLLRGCKHIKLGGISKTGSLRIVVSVKELWYKPHTTDEYKITMYQAAYNQVLDHLMSSYGVPRPKSLSSDLLSAISPLEPQGLISNITDVIPFPVDYDLKQ